MSKKSLLSSEQRRKLQLLFKYSNYWLIRQKILIALLINEGQTQKQVAEFLGCSLPTVNSCYREMVLFGIDGMFLRKNPLELGIKPKIFTEILAQNLEQSSLNLTFTEEE